MLAVHLQGDGVRRTHPDVTDRVLAQHVAALRIAARAQDVPQRRGDRARAEVAQPEHAQAGSDHGPRVGAHGT